MTNEKLTYEELLRKVEFYEKREKEIQISTHENFSDKSKQYFENLINHANAPIIVWNTNFEIQIFNKAFERLTGYNSKNVIGKRFDFIFPSSSIQDVTQKIDLTVKGDFWQTTEIPILCKNGDIKFVLWNSANIYETDNETLISTIAQGNDITEHKQSEAKIRESESNLISLINNTQDSIWSLDRDYNYIIFNRTYAELFLRDHGFEIKKGMNGKEIVAPEMLIFWESIYEPVFAGEKKVFEYTHSFDGSLRYFQTSISPIYENGEITGASAISVDISEVKLAQEELIKAKEKAEQSDMLKSAFLANMSHEIRTPLNSIVGFSKLITENKYDASSINKMKHLVEYNSNILVQIIDDIIDLSKIESGIINFKEEAVNLNSLMEDVYNTNKQLFSKLNKDAIEFVLKNDKLQKNINVDISRLTQILNNLISNAIKYTEKGSIEVGYSVKGSKIQFYVKDTGIGISKSDKANIFSRFYRVGNDQNTERGIGLGLAITKQILAHMNGEIWFESVLDKGSTFFFSIPYTESVPEVSPSAQDCFSNELDGKLALIAEDDEGAFFLTNILLEDSKVRVLRAKNGIEAVEICKENDSIDFVLMDMKMPLMDGLEATAKIREFRKELLIIALSAHVFSEFKLKAKEAGCNDYISKPLTEENLIETIIRNK